MNLKKHEPMRITPHFFQLGTPDFPAYLSLGTKGLLIEGGTGATFSIMVDQIKTLGVDPEKIEYIVLTHTHPDHIGAVPHFQIHWPHIKLLASAIGAKTLKRTELFREFQLVDLGIAQLMKAKSEIESLPDPVEDYAFNVDSIIKEGDRIDLGEGISWTVFETPGHSPCHVSLLEEKEGILALGDSTGFCVPEKGSIWPNYFDSLERYCDSIRKLSTLMARKGALSHNGMINEDVHTHLVRAMKATELYHNAIKERLNKGEHAEEIAMDGARFVDSLTDIQPFKIMYDLCKVLIRNSLQNGKPDHFVI
ncbi:MAG TPA: MBL fold metallo-hydrolase [Syntrophorhabdaceae bacterium]|nr:MBL fold metallo-hydrolase [Syntrophorhabdaceae bacterium]